VYLSNDMNKHFLCEKPLIERFFYEGRQCNGLLSAEDRKLSNAVIEDSLRGIFDNADKERKRSWWPDPTIYCLQRDNALNELISSSR